MSLQHVIFTSPSFPCWDTPPLAALVGDKSGDWKSSPNIRVPRDVANSTLRVATDNIDVLAPKFIRFETTQFHRDAALQRFLFKAATPELRQLILYRTCTDEDTLLLAHAVLSATNLEQLRIETSADTAALDFLFETLRAVHLKALRIYITKMPTNGFGCLLEQLILLEVLFPNLSMVVSLCQVLPIACPQLRILRCLTWLDAHASESLSDVLLLMPKLTELKVLFTDFTSLSALCDHFVQCKCCGILRMDFMVSSATHQQLGASERVNFFVKIFELLKSSFASSLTISVRLDFLASAPLLALSESGLLEEGWMSDVKFPWCNEPQPQLMQDLLARNKLRHVHCSRLCVCVIVLRKSKRSLLFMPFEHVLQIVRFLWMTRNQATWSDIPSIPTVAQDVNDKNASVDLEKCSLM